MSAKVGVFGIGLAAYWPQFEGLKERLEGYQAQVEQRLRLGAEVVSAGLVDTAPAAQQAGDLFVPANVDLIVCYVGTYSTSSQVLPAVQRRKAPVLILNLQPDRRASTTPTPTRASGWRTAAPAACRRSPTPSPAAAFQFNVVTGLLDPAKAMPTSTTTAPGGRSTTGSRRPACCANCSYSRIGFLGHTYPGMLDMYSDFTMHHAQLGAHVEVLEMDDLQTAWRKPPAEQRSRPRSPRSQRVFEIAAAWQRQDFDAGHREALHWSARVAVGWTGWWPIST